MNKLKRLWTNLRASFWFVPSLIVAVSVVIAVVLIGADFTGSEQWLARWPRLFGVGADGARGTMSTIGGSMMTVVGVTFSMVLMTLALVSSQYTSRILRNFMRDRVTQVVLGIFAGIFTYCLIVLLTIRGGVDGVFVPSVAVSFSVLLARVPSRNIPSSHRYEEEELRVIFIGPTFASLVAEAFDQIRGSANGNVTIMLRMLGAVQTIASLTASLSWRRALREQVQWVAELAERTIESPHDQARLESRLASVREAIETEPVLSAGVKGENPHPLKPPAITTLAK